jgi:hypothetical protein
MKAVIATAAALAIFSAALAPGAMAGGGSTSAVKRTNGTASGTQNQQTAKAGTRGLTEFSSSSAHPSR